MKTFKNIIQEAAYIGNLGAIEMIKFFQKATKTQIKEMEKIANSNDFEAFKKLIKQVIGVNLK